MNYVPNLNIFGVEAKEIPCITGSGAPTTSTAGAVGMFYMNTNSGKVYKCTSAVDGVYTWVDDISKLYERVPSFGYMLSNTQSLLNISPSAKTVTVNAGYMFIKNMQDDVPARLTITTKTLNIDQTSVFAFIVFDVTQSTVICINPNVYNCDTQYIVAIIRRDYYTNPSANWIPGPYEVDGYLYNAPVPQAVYVSPTGSDSYYALGTRNSPFATITKALSTGAKTIFITAGTYREKIALSSSNREIELIAFGQTKENPNVVLDYGITLTFTETDNGLMGAAFTSSETDFIYKAFVSQTETLVYDDGYVSDGYSVNLWNGNTKLIPKLTVSECLATENSWTYDGSIIYANCSATEMTLSDGSVDIGISMSALRSVKLSGITVKYARDQAVKLLNCRDSEIDRCEFAYTGLYNGLALENTNSIVRNCEAMYNRADGFNIHGVCTADFIDCISHDNWDDGISHHDKSNGAIIGGEYYNNGKGGVCSPTFGSRNGVNGVYIHDNVNGVYAVTNTGGDYPPCNVSNCAIVNNTYGIRTSRYTLNCWNNVLSGNTNSITEENGGTVNVIAGQ
jgi:hypothetical protein